MRFSQQKTKNTSLAVWRAHPLHCLNDNIGKEISSMAISTLLIVEDSPTQQHIYLHLCKRFGYDAYIAKSGEEGLAALKLTKYSAVILDIGLPGISGLEVARELRWTEMGTPRHTPVIGISSTEPAHKARQQCIDAGMDDYLSKPVSADGFRRMLLRWTYDSRTPNLTLLNGMVDTDIAV
jgi:CheY-like chemotaxis protein